jgi:hypothetical protein
VKFSAQYIHFGTVKIGKTTPWMSQTLTNNGNGPLHFTSIKLTGSHPGSFSFKDTCPKTLAAGKSCTISEYFKPLKAGDVSAAVTFADDAPFSAQMIYLTGTGKK